eukprot:GFYU01003658.1.p2 GENE.GFYU01003658.1~~GFYU01003658.1.p2  ORF type:complete len:369 (+),score=144.63 GFYU01003658.1:31-1107(+)
MLRAATFLAFACIVAACAASSHTPVLGYEVEGSQFLFTEFMKTHSKEYTTSEEYYQRLSVFHDNLSRIAELNRQNPEAEYGITEFSDLTEEEFVSQVLMMEMDPSDMAAPSAPEVLSTDDLPDSIDWREKNVVGPVQNQGSCGSCWAFSAMEDIQSKHFMKTGEMVDLSVQQILECDPHDAACYGGFPSKAFQYVIEAGGLVKEADYPYLIDNHTICLKNQTWNYTMCPDGDDDPCTFWCDQTCKAKLPAAAAKISSWEPIAQDEDQMAAALAQKGPLSIAFNASPLQFYRKGIHDPWMCNPNKINHAVQLVGYGTEDKPYWIVKNSWGAKWGEEGFFRIVRGKGKCGIEKLAVSSIV